MALPLLPGHEVRLDMAAFSDARRLSEIMRELELHAPPDWRAKVRGPDGKMAYSIPVVVDDTVPRNEVQFLEGAVVVKRIEIGSEGE